MQGKKTVGLKKTRYGTPTRRKATSLRLMSEVEAAYVGALVDGEGCIRNQDVHSRGGGRSVSVVVGNTELELISALLRITGIGVVCKDKPQLGRLPFWRWGVYAIEDTKSLLRRIAAYSLKAQWGLTWAHWSDE